MSDRYYQNGLGGAGTTLSALTPLVTRDRKVYYVHSSTGSDASGYGLTRAAPYASLQYLINTVNPSEGSIIVMGAGHEETVTDEIVVSQRSLYITAEGDGATLTCGLTGANVVSVSAEWVTMENITFAPHATSDFSDYMLYVNNWEFTGIGLRFECNERSTQYGCVVNSANSNVSRWIDCEFVSTATDETTPPKPGFYVTGSTTCALYMKGCSFDGGTTEFKDGNYRCGAQLAWSDVSMVTLHDITLSNGADMLMPAAGWTGTIQLSATTGDGAVVLAEAS